MIATAGLITEKRWSDMEFSDRCIGDPEWATAAEVDRRLLMAEVRRLQSELAAVRAANPYP